MHHALTIPEPHCSNTPCCNRTPAMLLQHRALIILQIWCSNTPAPWSQPWSLHCFNESCSHYAQASNSEYSNQSSLLLPSRPSPPCSDYPWLNPSCWNNQWSSLQRWASTLANRSNARHRSDIRGPTPPPPQMYVFKVWESVGPEGQEATHS